MQRFLLFFHTYSALKNPVEHLCKITMKNNNPIWAGAPRSFHFLSKTWFLINNNSISKMVNRVFHCRTGHQMIRNSMLQSKTSVHIYTYLKLSHELIDFFGSIQGTKHNMDF